MVNVTIYGIRTDPKDFIHGFSLMVPQIQVFGELSAENSDKRRRVQAVASPSAYGSQMEYIGRVNLDKPWCSG